MLYNTICRFIPRKKITSFYELSTLGIDYEEDKICSSPTHPENDNKPNCAIRYYVISRERYAETLAIVGIYCIHCLRAVIYEVSWYVRVALRFRLDFDPFMDDQTFGLELLFA